MILQLGVLFLGGLLSVTSALPPCICTRNLKPVCGSNGHTYSNECLLRCAQVTDPELFKAKSGSCDDSGHVLSRNVRYAEAECFCTFEYMPICGTDGRTYPNHCTFICAKRSTPVEIAFRGPCRVKRETVRTAQLPSRCSCPRILAPVCGSDGKTYDNDCVLDCNSQNRPELRLQHVGLCETRSCSCSREAIPVCGNDGNTYENPCYLRCAKESNKDLDILHDGECDNSVKVVDSPACTCTREARPVCGTDGKTYSNPCMLKCARDNNENLHIDHEGPCNNKVQVVDSACAGCTLKKKPVCGTDGNTYRNPCMLNCARDNNQSLHINHIGPCDIGVQLANLCVGCTRKKRPVCGTDGYTYINPCMLNCAREKDESLHIHYEGPCDNGVKVVGETENVSCACTKNLRPVCASNGVTFSNKCLMRCAGTHLKVAKEGPCED